MSDKVPVNKGFPAQVVVPVGSTKAKESRLSIRTKPQFTGSFPREKRKESGLRFQLLLFFLDV